MRSDLKYFIRECGEILNITSELKTVRTPRNTFLSDGGWYISVDCLVVLFTVAKDPIKSSHRDVMLQHYAKSAGSNSNSEWKESEDRLVLREGK